MRMTLFVVLFLVQVTAKADASKKPVSDKQDHKASLDSMLGGLEQDLQNLGIATVPKGHCASCQKPIAGKVGRAKTLMLRPSTSVCVGLYPPKTALSSYDLRQCSTTYKSFTVLRVWD